MTQAAVNNAVVLYRLTDDRDSVHKAQELYFMAPELQKVLTNPTLSIDQKYGIIDRVFSAGGIPQIIINYIKMMCRLGYCGEMEDIFSAYDRYYDSRKHILRAQFIQAEPSEEDTKEAWNFLKGRYPDETIEMTEQYDASLMGGYVIKVGQEEYDRSFEGRFRQLERKLTGR